MNEELNQINNDFQENVDETTQQPVVEIYEKELTNYTSEKKEPKKGSSLPLILSGISLVGIIVLFVLFFRTGNNHQSTQYFENQNITKIPSTGNASEMRVAFVNTDSILQKYALVEESKKDMEALHAQKERQFSAAQSKLEADYNTYIQSATASNLTLQQQQDKEAELTRRGMELQQMEEQFSTEISQKLLEKNKATADSVINFIKRYNQIHNYTLILEKSGVNGVLYGEPTMDITQDILKGLNAEYEAVKKKK